MLSLCSRELTLAGPRESQEHVEFYTEAASSTLFLATKLLLSRCAVTSNSTQRVPCPANVFWMPELGKFFGLAFSALLPLVNPLGDALVFLGLVGDAPPTVYRSLARRIAISTTIFLIAIELGGTLILNFFGILYQWFR